jgi:Zn-dependent M28 family amino/carboxypeptidase
MRFAEGQVSFGARVPGTSAHTQAADLIQSELERSGWKVENQVFEYRGVGLRNLRGTLSGPNGPVVLLGAHYDSRKVADQESGSTQGPVPGANDGASGVAVLLELARVLPSNPVGCQVQLAFFDGEDSGGLDGWQWIVGSTYFADHLTTTPEAVVIVDMVGDEDLDLFMEGNSDPGLRGGIWETGSSLGHPAFVPIVKYSMVDDHIPFVGKGIPSVDIIDFDYPYWHTTHDTLDKLSPASLEQVGRTLQSWLTKCPASLGE